MSRSKFINTFEHTSDYETYIESDYPLFPNVALDKEENKLKIRTEAIPSHLIHGITTATSNFYIVLNNSNVEVTVDNGEFYLDEWTGTLTSLYSCFDNLSHITSIDQFNLDTSSVTTFENCFNRCSNLSSVDVSNINISNATNLGGMFAQCPLFTSLDLSSFDTSSVERIPYMFYNDTQLTSLNLNNWDLTNLSTSSSDRTWTFQDCSSLTDVYINNSTTLNKLTNNLSSQSNQYIPSSVTIHYDDGTQIIDYVWQNSSWTVKS